MIRVLGFDSWWGLGIVLFTTTSIMALGPTQPPIQWVPGALFLGVKLTTHPHLLPWSKNDGAIPPLPQYAFMAWCSAKAQGQLYLYLTDNQSLEDELLNMAQVMGNIQHKCSESSI
jgi:hypothetical protein